MTDFDHLSLPFPFPTISYRPGAVVLIDQTKLPETFGWRECRDIASLCQAIVELAVRGAPALGIAAAYGLVLAWEQGCAAGWDTNKIVPDFNRARQELAATRPTAVNLFWALERMVEIVEREGTANAQPDAILSALHREADLILHEDIATCRALGSAGARLLPDEATVLTHCNAGGLATGGYGTALGVVYASQEAGKKIRVFADETRPLLQGARLTAWELVQRGIEVTVVCDSAAATFLREGAVDAVITGADRIARNGDTANKIGTYPLAVMAREHDVPFYIAAPASTFDPATVHGRFIEVEMRPEGEVITCGPHLLAPEGVKAANPAFDVTPADFVTGFITELGVIKPPYGETLGPVLAASRRRGHGTS